MCVIKIIFITRSNTILNCTQETTRDNLEIKYKDRPTFLRDAHTRGGFRGGGGGGGGGGLWGLKTPPWLQVMNN